MGRLRREARGTGSKGDAGGSGEVPDDEGPRGARAAEQERFVRELMAEHGRALLAYAVRLCGDRHAAEDVVQEVLVRAWQRAEQLTEAHGSVRGWLLTVTRNLVIDQARARAARPREVADLEGAGEAAGAVTDHAGAVVDSITVVGMLDALSPEHREVLVELYYRDRSTAQAAEVLGVPAGTVKSRAYYALRALRQSAQQRRTGPLAHGSLS